MSITENLHTIKTQLPNGVTLVVVSKFQPIECILEAYHAGQKIFGESRSQELAQKAEILPKDIEWHFIGHLQSNKVKQVVKYASLIHSVDSWKLLEEIDSECAKQCKSIDCLLEVHIAEEQGKFGFLSASLSHSFTYLPTYAKIIGLMGMATFTDNQFQIRQEFQILKNLVKMHGNASLPVLSMGMSEDWKIAVEEGSTMLRIGTAIFGER
ncbi:MAG: YggS family pyridoxal phosphate-dependent enzyme [Bacteroidales bacterium]|jgi:pyridoxal phosphate enzyme (YggS family)|nr:YggS family pyridoxal phosphate-dependent enzyme [Bacteroidales bacterium]